MRLSAWLALRCKEPEFQRFLRSPDEATCVRVVRALCNVESRSEVDTNPEAASRCHVLIRLPYLAYTQERSPA